MAGTAVGSHWLWRLAVPIVVLVCRQPPADQPRLADRGWTAARERLRERSVSRARVDFDAVKRFKHAFSTRRGRTFSAGWRSDLRPAFERFTQDHAHWLDDYALFRALKARHAGASYLEWPDDLVRRTPAALDRARRELPSQIEPVRFAQFLLFRQGARLKAHARAKGVRLIGDLPFFVSPDSSDVWANPELFLLDSQHRPHVVAGVPPDYFSAQGQRWGNPLYDWDALARAAIGGGSIARAPCSHTSTRSVSTISADSRRRGTYRPSAPTAQSGRWVPGPGAEFFDAVEKALGGCPSSPRTWESSRRT